MNIELRQQKRSEIMRLEEAMRAMPQREIPLQHMFWPGMYVRGIFIPKNTTLVGLVHRYACFNVIPYGDIMIVTETGDKQVIGPCSFVSEAGTKRAGYSNEDTVWMTFHNTSETDIGKLESLLVTDQLETLCHF
jgi:hypothetical protein